MFSVGKGAGESVGEAMREPVVYQDSVSRIVLHFRFDDATLDRSFMNNAAGLDLLENITAEVISIDITCTTSPEGKLDHNRKLAGRRADSVEVYLAGIIPTGSAAVSRNLHNFRWVDIVESVEADPNIPGRDAVLAVVNDRTIDEIVKMAKIMKLEGGATFKYLKDNTLPAMRIGTVVITMRNAAPVVKP